MLTHDLEWIMGPSPRCARQRWLSVPIGSLYDVLRGAGIVSAENARLVGTRRGRPDQEGTSNERSPEGLVLGAREPPAPNWGRRLWREISRLQSGSLTSPTLSSS